MWIRGLVIIVIIIIREVFAVWLATLCVQIQSMHARVVHNYFLVDIADDIVCFIHVAMCIVQLFLLFQFTIEEKFVQTGTETEGLKNMLYF